jgi:hypothetical protein
MSSTGFIAKIFRWLKQVNADPELPASAAKVAIRLSPDFNEQRGGMAWSAFKTMGDDISLSERHVIRAIRALEARGHLRVKWGKQGRGHSSQYWMLERQPDLFDDKKPAPAPVFQQNKTGISGTGKPASGVRKPASGVVKPAPAPEILSRPTDQPSRGTHRTQKQTHPPNQVGKKRPAGKASNKGAAQRTMAASSIGSGRPFPSKRQWTKRAGCLAASSRARCAIASGPIGQQAIAHRAVDDAGEPWTVTRRTGRGHPRRTRWL